jgi:hypothetical protein
MIDTSRIHLKMEQSLIKLSPGLQEHALLVGRQISAFFLPEITVIVSEYAAEHIPSVIIKNPVITTGDTKWHRICQFINDFSTNLPQRNVDVIFKTSAKGKTY